MDTPTELAKQKLQVIVDSIYRTTIKHPEEENPRERLAFATGYLAAWLAQIAVDYPPLMESIDYNYQKVTNPHTGEIPWTH